MPAEGVQKLPRGQMLSFEEIVGFVRALRRRLCVSKVRITGGEPLVRAGVVELVRMLAAEGLDDLALTTNGQLLAEAAGDLRRAGLRRVNVSLDSLDAATFLRLTRGGELGRTVEGIEAALDAGLLPVKVNTVVLRGWNDQEPAALARFALGRGCPIRFLELMPIGLAGPLFEGLFVPEAEVGERLAQSFRLEPLGRRRGETSRDFRAADAQGISGVIGFISPCTHPFCGDCNRLRLTSTGGLMGCLARAEAVDVRPLLQGGGDEAADRLAALATSLVAGKAPCPGFSRSRPMSSVGG
jgi:cyclic pyranopterin phosphate synthase